MWLEGQNINNCQGYEVTQRLAAEFHNVDNDGLKIMAKHITPFNQSINQSISIVQSVLCNTATTSSTVLIKLKQVESFEKVQILLTTKSRVLWANRKKIHKNVAGNVVCAQCQDQ